mmetsp:Transcript_763/g.2210  ORF Transcript_763/g.2210 Transcript_763/m.2210 type:complete len:121 (+) Transcript_763:1020-1382(+)
MATTKRMKMTKTTIQQQQQPKQSYKHCTAAEYENPQLYDPSKTNNGTESVVFNMCCLDPYYYPAGLPAVPVNPSPISFHANFVHSRREKLAKLKGVLGGYGWDESRLYNLSTGAAVAAGK